MPRSVRKSGKRSGARIGRARAAIPVPAAAPVTIGQGRVLEMIATGKPLAAILAELIRVIEIELPGTLGSILLLDDDGVHLRHGAAPSLPAAFAKAIDGEPIGPRAGSCGTAAFRRKAVVVEDIRKDPLWTDYRRLAAAHGLRACWSTPIFDPKKKLIGTFAMYQREPGRPTPRHRKSIAMATHTAAIAIVRQREVEALRASEGRVRGILEGMTTGFIALDRDWRFTAVNARAAEIVGRSAASMLGRRYLEVFPEAKGSPFELAYRKAMKERAMSQTEHHFAPWDRWFEQRVEPTPEGILVFFQDVTERKRNELRIQRLNRVYAVLSGINSLIVRERNRAELFREACRIAVEVGGFRMAWAGVVNPGAARIAVAASCGMDEAYQRQLPLALHKSARDFGLAGSAVGGRTPVVVDDLAIDPKITLRTQARERGLHSAALLPLVIGDRAVGVLALYATEIAYFDAEEMKLLNELAGDISFGLEHIEKSEKVDYLAFYDQLTGLANRSLFVERLAQNLQAAAHEGRKVGVGVVDIERFKTINDSLGRQAGDELLKQVARRFGAYAVDARNLARLDMDHFAVMVPGLKSAESAARLTEQRVKDCFGPPFDLHGTALRVSAKLGIALYPDDGEDAETLLKNAEAALKNAKDTGERYLFYTQRMTERVAEKLSLEHKLQRALENGEFVLHYQPKVDAATRRICGVEALIRWQSAELGLVPPMKFIPLMEETGLILEAGAWALRRAALDHRAWQEAGLRPPRVAVNVSPMQLRRREFVDVVAEAIGHGVAPCALDLEITESLIMEDIEPNILKLKRIRELGLRVAIDDFGTGYSSLAYLARLPVQTLKIDRSFIITMLNDAGTMTLVQTIVSLAHSLRLSVVAEGVDDAEQAKMLRLLRCDEMQGYLFSKPVPAEAFAAMLGSGKPLG